MLLKGTLEPTLVHTAAANLLQVWDYTPESMRQRLPAIVEKLANEAAAQARRCRSRHIGTLRGRRPARPLVAISPAAFQSVRVVHRVACVRTTGFAGALPGGGRGSQSSHDTQGSDCAGCDLAAREAHQGARVAHRVRAHSVQPLRGFAAQTVSTARLGYRRGPHSSRRSVGTSHCAASGPSSFLAEAPTPAFGNFHGHSHAGMLVRDPSAYRTDAVGCTLTVACGSASWAAQWRRINAEATRFHRGSVRTRATAINRGRPGAGARTLCAVHALTGGGCPGRT